MSTISREQFTVKEKVEIASELFAQIEALLNQGELLQRSQNQNDENKRIENRNSLETLLTKVGSYFKKNNLNNDPVLMARLGIIIQRVEKLGISAAKPVENVNIFEKPNQWLAEIKARLSVWNTMVAQALSGNRPKYGEYPTLKAELYDIKRQLETAKTKFGELEHTQQANTLLADINGVYIRRLQELQMPVPNEVVDLQNETEALDNTLFHHKTFLNDAQVNRLDLARTIAVKQSFRIIETSFLKLNSLIQQTKRIESVLATDLNRTEEYKVVSQVVKKAEELVQTFNKIKTNIENRQQKIIEQEIESLPEIKNLKGLMQIVETVADVGTLPKDRITDYIQRLKKYSREATDAYNRFKTARSAIMDARYDTFVNDNYFNKAESLTTRIKEEAGRKEEEERSLTDILSNMRKLLDVAKAGSVAIDTDKDSISENFEPLQAAIRNIPKTFEKHPEIIELQKEVLVTEFEKRIQGYLKSMNKIENTEPGIPKIISTHNDIHQTRIFGRMKDIVNNLESRLGYNPVKIVEMRAEIVALEKNSSLRFMQAFTWAQAKNDLFYGSDHGGKTIRTIPGGLSAADVFTGEQIQEDINNVELQEKELDKEANVVTQEKREIMRRDVARGINRESAGETVVFNAVPGNPKLVEVVYKETALAWVMQVLDDIYAKDYYNSIGTKTFNANDKKYIKVDGILYQLPLFDEVKNEPVNASNLHLNDGYNKIIDFIHKIEVSKRVPQNPRFSRELVQRAFRQHIMTNWGPQTEARSSTLGIGDNIYYALDWPSYAKKEYIQGIATYNILPTVFIFGYDNFSPWKLLGKDAEAKVKGVLNSLTVEIEEEVEIDKNKENPLFSAARRLGINKSAPPIPDKEKRTVVKKVKASQKYGFLLDPFVTLKDTSTRKDKPNYTVFSPPLRSVAIGQDGNNEPLRYDREDGSQGMIITPDDVRNIDGKRLYNLIPFERMGNYANVYKNFSDNAIYMLSSIFKKDVSQWDVDKNGISAQRKEAKYTAQLFPSVGLEVYYNPEVADMFIDRFAMYLVLVKAIMIVMPAGISGGQDKSLKEVNAFLRREISKRTINEEKQEVIYKIIEALYEGDVFRRELAQEIVKQFENLYRFNR